MNDREVKARWTDVAYRWPCWLREVAITTAIVLTIGVCGLCVAWILKNLCDVLFFSGCSG